MGTIHENSSIHPKLKEELEQDGVILTFKCQSVYQDKVKII